MVLRRWIECSEEVLSKETLDEWAERSFVLAIILKSVR